MAQAGDNGQVLVASKNMPIAEMIGRGRAVARSLTPTLTVDWSQADYAFWDQLRRGKKADYELGGLFARPIARSLVSWALGKGIMAEVDDKTTQEAIAQFITNNMKLIRETAEDSLSLGDSYQVTNADGTITRVSPEQVKILASPEGSQNIVGYEVKTKLISMTITDTYMVDGRTVITEQGGTKDTQKYTNLIGMIPVTHWANDRGANEVHGRPYYEQLLKLFARYDRVINKALDGVELMGNPIPVVDGAEDPEETLRRIATSKDTYIDSNGVSRERMSVDFNELAIMVLGKGGSFKFAAPNQFTQDAGRVLEYLFLLMLQASGIPEWVWGGAIASSKASVEAQMPAFELLIEWLRLAFAESLQYLIKSYLATIALYTPGIRTDLPIEITFPSIAIEDRTQKLEEIKFAREDRQIRRVTGLQLLDLVDDPENEVQLAEQEASDNEAAFNKTLDQMIQRQAGQQNKQQEDPVDEGAIAA